MKKLAIALASVLCVSANATCFGTGAFRTCTDNSGNTYTVQQYGNTTRMQGYGPNGTRNQTSQTIGNTTYQSGTAVNGQPWHGTQTQIANTQVFQRVDSRGQYYQRTCTPYGCY